MTTTPSPELPDLDRGYFKGKLAIIVRDLSHYTAPEMARELVRLAKAADESEAVKEARRAQPEGEAPQAAPLRADHRATIEEAAQVLESAAAHNRFKGRTVLEHQQQDRADRLRAILSVQHATPSTASRDAHQLASLILQDPDGGRMVISSPLESGADGAMWFTATNPETRASARITISIEHDYDPATAQHAEIGAPAPNAERVDAIVTGLYRRFKDWSKRGFGPDDVTWCEVKADVIALIATGAAESGAQAGELPPLPQGVELGWSTRNVRIMGYTYSMMQDYARQALAAQSQGAQAAPGIVITLRQAHRLVEFFGGHDARVTITPPRAEWGDMPPGLYAFCTEYPEDGSEHLGETEVDDDLSSLGERGHVARAALAAKAEAPAPLYCPKAFEELCSITAPIYPGYMVHAVRKMAEEISGVRAALKYKLDPWTLEPAEVIRAVKVVVEFANAHLASAQQAAAPGALKLQPDTKTLQFLTDVVTAAGLLEHGKQSKGLAERISRTAYELRTDLFEGKAAPSAPGTPEAPSKDALRYIGWRDAVLREDRDFVCAIENGLPTDVLEQEDDRAPTASEWDAAIDYAMGIKRAAQLDGGQEGSDRG